MGVWSAVVIGSLFSACATVASLFAVYVALSRAGRERLAARDRGSAGGVATIVRRPAAWLALVALASTLLPWVSGSAVGVELPHTLWGLPWIRWVLAAPIVFTLALTLIWHGGSRVLLVLRVVGFGTTVWLSSGALVVASLAQRVSRWTFVGDTLLRGSNHLDMLLPVVRVGPGPIVCSTFSLAGAFACVVWPFRGSVAGGQPLPSPMFAGSAGDGIDRLAQAEEQLWT